MANAWGYPVIQTDLSGLWLTGGDVKIQDGYGTPTFSAVPSGIVRSVKRNSTGNYSIVLQEAWYALIGVDISLVIPSGSSPDLLIPELKAFTVGNAAVLPVQAGGVGQSVTFQVYDKNAAATELASGSQFLFTLALKQSSA